MKTYLFAAILVLSGMAQYARCASLYNYIEALDNNFTAVRKHKVIQVSAKPRLFEEDFARFVQVKLDEKQTQKQIRTAWISKQKEMKNDGYVFNVVITTINAPFFVISE